MVTVKEELWRVKAKAAHKQDPTSTYVGAACPKCWLPMSLNHQVDSSVCQCGNRTSPEEVLAAHGLLGLRAWLIPGPGLPRASKEAGRSDG